MTMTTDKPAAVPAWLNLDAVASPELRDQLERLKEKGEDLLADLVDWLDAAIIALWKADEGCAGLEGEPFRLVCNHIGSGPVDDLRMMIGTIAQYRDGVMMVAYFDELCERFKVAGTTISSVRAALIASPFGES